MFQRCPSSTFGLCKSSLHPLFLLTKISQWWAVVQNYRPGWLKASHSFNFRANVSIEVHWLHHCCSAFEEATYCKLISLQTPVSFRGRSCFKMLKSCFFFSFDLCIFLVVDGDYLICWRRIYLLLNRSHNNLRLFYNGNIPWGFSVQQSSLWAQFLFLDVWKTWRS